MDNRDELRERFHRAIWGTPLGSTLGGENDNPIRLRRGYEPNRGELYEMVKESFVRLKSLWDSAKMVIQVDRPHKGAKKSDNTLVHSA